MLFVKASTKRKFELFLLAFLGSIISNVRSEFSGTENRLCETVELSPVQLFYKNKTMLLFQIYNVDVEENGQNLTTELIKGTNEVLIQNNIPRKNCACSSPCRIKCCPYNQKYSKKYDYITKEESENYSNFNSGKLPCAKNYLDEGYFSPSKFNPLTTRQNDVMDGYLYKHNEAGILKVFEDPVNVVTEPETDEVAYATDLNYFCQDKKKSLDDIYEYYLLDDASLLRKSKTNPLYELVLTNNYCTVLKDWSISFFEMCGNHYGLHLDKKSDFHESSNGEPSSAIRAKVMNILGYGAIKITNPIDLLVSLPVLTVLCLLYRI